ncbi:hypothetical protein [Streptomyces sp. NPDC056240]|uniref:hypothetical protein n=1 Tax=Streptomyces sp. NPDC056240 TaxID=3345759 RepID=UPI0035E21591
MPKERSSEKKAARQLAAARGIPYTAALRLLREQRDTPLPVPTEAGGMGAEPDGASVGSGAAGAPAGGSGAE